MFKDKEKEKGNNLTEQVDHFKPPIGNTSRTALEPSSLFRDVSCVCFVTEAWNPDVDAAWESSKTMLPGGECPVLRVSNVEIYIHHPYLFPLGIPYHIHVTTGDVRNASTNARVYVILHGGEDGENNSGKLWLQNEKKDNFERGRTDIFTVETTEMLSPLHHLTIGHDNSGLGAGWYCEKVMSSHHLCFLLLTSDALASPSCLLGLHFGFIFYSSGSL